jgi:hypothetical protein
MRLHHFCRASDLTSIAEKGLYPHTPVEGIMSLGREVVWLTSGETPFCSEDELQYMAQRKRWTPEEIEITRRHGWLLDTGRTHRLTVCLRSGSKLQNYGDWLRANGDTVIVKDGMASANDAGELFSVRHMAEGLSPWAKLQWWLYFGRIPPSKIEGLPPKGPKRVEADELTALDHAIGEFIGTEYRRTKPATPWERAS